MSEEYFCNIFIYVLKKKQLYLIWTTQILGWPGGAIVGNKKVVGSAPNPGLLVEFACSPCVCLAFLQEFRLPPTIQIDIQLIGNSKFFLSVNISVWMFCLSVWPCDELLTCPGYHLTFTLT